MEQEVTVEDIKTLIKQIHQDTVSIGLYQKVMQYARAQWVGISPNDLLGFTVKDNNGLLITYPPEASETGFTIYPEILITILSDCCTISGIDSNPTVD